jgi:hypothetical protein
MAASKSLSSNKFKAKVLPLFSPEVKTVLEKALLFAEELEEGEEITNTKDLTSKLEPTDNSKHTLRQTSNGSGFVAVGLRGIFYNSDESEGEAEGDEDGNASSQSSKSDDEGETSGQVKSVNAHRVYDVKYETDENDKTSSLGQALNKLSTASSSATSSQVPSLILPLPEGENKKASFDTSSRADAEVKLPHRAIVTPTVVLVPGRMDWSTRDVCREYLNWSQQLAGFGKERHHVAVILLRSGRFAGGIFEKSKCLVHTTSTRYTVRKGQGGAQSSNDNSKGKAKSIGSQLRREGEKALREDVTKALQQWSDYLKHSVGLVFVSCPKVMKRSLYEECAKGILSKDDARIRSIPLSVKRPSFEEVCRVHETLLSVTVRDMTNDERTALHDAMMGGDSASRVEITADIKRNEKHSDSTLERDEVQRPTFLPLTPLHEAARDADLNTLSTLLDEAENAESASEAAIVDARCGPTEMTPLHYAAAYTGDNMASAASVIRKLLLRARANPCVVDSHGRPPYFLAVNDRIRDSFRLARGELGEDYCDWDDGAKLGPPLTKDLVQQKQEKAAEKKRKQRARQKEKKAQERKEAEEEELKERERLEEEQRMEDAKRIRDGLKPKPGTASGNSCDFCQKVVKKKSQMFTRLIYRYCSPECVKSHQRELMAAAAIARLGG